MIEEVNTMLDRGIMYQVSNTDGPDRFHIIANKNTVELFTSSDRLLRECVEEIERLRGEIARRDAAFCEYVSGIILRS